jgi:hypothetical protein
MKKEVFILLSFVLLLLGCNKSSSSNSAVSGTKEISGEAVYYQNGKESSFNGNVVLYNEWLRFLGITISLGTVENGKLAMTLPDIDKIDGIPPNRIEKIQDYLDDLDLNIKVVPEDAKWFPFKYPLSLEAAPLVRIVVFSDDKEPNIWNRDEINSIYYVLNLSDNSVATQLILVFFTKDTTIKGKAFEYDIDIKAKRGWNKIYVDESESGIVVKSTPKPKQNFRWTASRTQLWSQPAGALLP